MLTEFLHGFSHLSAVTLPFTAVAKSDLGFQNAPRKQVEMLVESLASLNLVGDVGALEELRSRAEVQTRIYIRRERSSLNTA